MNIPDGGTTDEPMPPEFARAYAEAYPDRVKEYVSPDKVTALHLLDALRAAQAENARLSKEIHMLRTNSRAVTFGNLGAPHMRNIPDQEGDIARNEYRVPRPIDFTEYRTPEMRDNAQINPGHEALIADLVMLRDHRTVPAGHWERTIDAAITALRALGGEP